MHLPCDIEDSPKVTSDERNEEQSSQIESPAKGQGTVNMLNPISYLVIFLKLIQCLQDLQLWTK